MKSPFTGKEMKPIYEKSTWKFRGEEFEYYQKSWLCEDTNERFTTDGSDDAGFIQVTNQYREKYGIPYTDEIINIRKRYHISAAKMSTILGLGINQYRLYEQGEVPSVSNGRMILSISNPKVMLEMVESSRNTLSSAEFEKITAKVWAAISDNDSHKFRKYEESRIYSCSRGLDNGFAPISLLRLKNILLYILERCDKVWMTKMNKLLFYIDFISYRERGISMSGLSYKAIQYGPVPENWNKVYSEFPEILSDIHNYGIILRTQTAPDITIFSDKEIEIMDNVCEHFKTSTAKRISEESHREKAWMNYHQEHERIPFEEAFALKL